MKLLILGPPSCTEESLIKEAVLAFSLKPTEIVIGDDTEFYKTVGRIFPSATFQKFKINWKDIKRPGAVVKKGKYGEYNSKAGFHRDEDMVKLVKEHEGQVLIIEQNSETDSLKKMVKANGIEPMLFNVHKSENKEVLYRL